MKKTILLIIVMFFTGWFFNSAYSLIIDINNVSTMNDSVEEPTGIPVIEFGSNDDKYPISAPHDHIKESDIHVYDDRVVIYLDNPEWSTFSDTNSMVPVFDIGSNAVRIKPKTTEEIQLGDIISYKSSYADGIIIHRVVEIDEDNDGWYCKVKGDNNIFMDPGKIRFEQILGVNVMIIW